MFRPEAASWFEVLVAHDDCAATLGALARNGAIELDTRVSPTMVAPLMELKPLLDRYAELARRFAAYWPEPQLGRTSAPGSPREVLLRALGHLSMWHATAEPLVRTLQALEYEVQRLGRWQALLEYFRDSDLDFGALADKHLVLERRVYLFPTGVVPPQPESGLWLEFEISSGPGVLVVASHDSLDAYHRRATALKGRVLVAPRWLRGPARENLQPLLRRRERARRGAERLRGMIARIGVAYELAPALGDIESMYWFATQVERLPGSEHFAWVHGWTSAPEPVLRAALSASGVRALIRYVDPPSGVTSPLLLRNPAWVRPFELFARALGIPGRNEIDPSPLLAVVVPLLFGYMFADVGQGMVILIGSLWLSRRYPVARLLAACGGAAMVFGLLFGSVFSREDWIAPLWLHPLAHPLPVLELPLLLGAVLLAIGLALNGIGAYWRGQGHRWLLADAGILLAYVTALPALIHPRLYVLTAAGVFWYLAGSALAERRIAAIAAAAAHLLEQGFQLAINTLSFTRVGAFALAHAGLSSAVVVLAGSAGHPGVAFLIMLTGNIVIIVLEALVVSIQTTRLMLFEFFVRFLQGTGRPFRPLALPASIKTRGTA
jgi:V/A-type H+-transporting ATPase subunit I